MSDACPMITIVVDIQENGIVRTEDGHYLCRLENEPSYEEVKERIIDKGLKILDEKGVSLRDPVIPMLDYPVYVGEHTKLLGEFLHRFDLTVSNPDLCHRMRVTGFEKRVKDAHAFFKQYFPTKHIDWYGQNRYGFSLDVSDMTMASVITGLDKAFKNIELNE